MFDHCRVWRSLLTCRAEGGLSPGQRAMLDEHLASCDSCRAIRDADDILHDFGTAPGAALPEGRERLFDDSVIRDLRVAGAQDQLPAGWRGRVRACANSFSFEFCMQLAGGGLAAACVTAFLVVSALNPVSNENSLSAYEQRAISAIERNEPPVPLESLFQSPTPRAAMLWAAPGRSLQATGAETSSSNTEPKDKSDRKQTPRRHGRASVHRYEG